MLKVVNKLGNLIILLTTRRDMVILFLLAVGLRLLLLIVSVDQIGTEKFLSTSPDTVNYVKMAVSLVKGTFTNEKGFFIFGPGYACFLAPFFFLFGVHAMPVILFQIVLSGFACILIFKFAMLLTRSHAVSMIAGLLAATSYTSISLSCVLLSDSSYFFFFLTGLILFLKGLIDGGWKYFFLSGILTGFAILCRSIGQFWPLMMIIIALTVHITVRKESPDKPRLSLKRRMIGTLICIGIVVLLVSSWMIRNYFVHGIPTLSSAGKLGNVALMTLHRLEGKTVEEIWKQWEEHYQAEKKVEKLTREDAFRMSLAESRRVLKNHPWEMLKTYLRLVWINLNEINHFHRALLPNYNPKTIPWGHEIKQKGWNYVNFYLSMAGLLLLLVTRRFRTFVVLGLVYFYYAAMIAFSHWQGSRMFFPGQIAWAVLIAVAFVSTYRFMKRLASVVKRPVVRRLND